MRVSVLECIPKESPDLQTQTVPLSVIVSLRLELTRPRGALGVWTALPPPPPWGVMSAIEYKMQHPKVSGVFTTLQRCGSFKNKAPLYSLALGINRIGQACTTSFLCGNIRGYGNNP